MTLDDDRAARWFFGLVAFLSLPFYLLGASGAALPFARALPISALMACVPAIVAMILTTHEAGSLAAAGLFANAFRLRSVCDLRWCLLAFCAMPAAFAVTGGAVWLFMSGLPALTPLPVSAVVPAFAMFFLGALAEEIGWQGYAYPRLRKHHSALSAAVMIGVFWALWHVVPFVLSGRGANWIFWHGLGMVLMRIIIVWLVANAGQSILVAVLFHLMSNSVWGLFANFDPYYSPTIMCLVLLVPITTILIVWGPYTRIRRGLMFLALMTAMLCALLANVILVGLPMANLPQPQGRLIGAVLGSATDTARPDLFSGAAQRVIPFQILYPARQRGAPATYLPDADLQVAALADSHGWIFDILLGQIGTLAAPWSDMAKPFADGPFPVVLYLPGVTGYMQMSSFQTSELAAHGYIVVTLNQPGAVSAAQLPDGQIVTGLTREAAVALVRPSYRTTHQSLPDGMAKRLAPDVSIVPYLAADVGTVLDRLALIDADPKHILYGLLNLDRVGVMGMSLGAIETAQACADEPRIDACLMMDAPVPTAVAAVGLRQAALWISRPTADQRRERTSSGGWPEDEIDAQAQTIARALTNSEHGQLVFLPGLFHVDFTDLPAIQPMIGWLGQAGPVGADFAHRQINDLTLAFFARNLGTVQIISKNP
jgi:membrane protease YdiL (CAAX protease family)